MYSMPFAMVGDDQLLEGVYLSRFFRRSCVVSKNEDVPFAGCHVDFAVSVGRRNVEFVSCVGAPEHLSVGCVKAHDVEDVEDVEVTVNVNRVRKQ